MEYKQIQEIPSKANRMFGCVKRTALAIHEVSVRKVLYLAIVDRSQLAYCCQVWAPQSVTNISTIERVQRRATKFIFHTTRIYFTGKDWLPSASFPYTIDTNIWT